MATGNPYPKGTLEYTEWENEHPNGEDTEEQTNRVGKENGTLEVAGGTTPTPSTPVMQTPPVVQAPTATATEPTPATPAATTPQQKRYGTYDDIYAYLRSEMERNLAETDEERKKREKREKTLAIISGIADMGSALSNLGWATQGAPNMYDPKEGMTPKYQELFDKQKADREAKRERYLHAMNMMATLQDREAAREQAAEAAEQAQQNWREKFEFEKQKEADRNEIKQKELELKDAWQQGKLSIAQLNANIKKMVEQGKANRSDINHKLASWTRTVNIERDAMGREIGRTEQRIVENPKTGEYEVKETYTPAQQPKPTSGKKTLPNGKKKLPNQQ